jgi:hypothetical protein
VFITSYCNTASINKGLTYATAGIYPVTTFDGTTTTTLSVEVLPANDWQSLTVQPLWDNAGVATPYLIKLKPTSTINTGG